MQAGEEPPPLPQRPTLLVLSAVVADLLADPQRLDATVLRLAPQVALDETLLLRAARKVLAQHEEACARGR